MRSLKKIRTPGRINETLFIQEAQEKTDEITAKFLDKEKDPLKYQPTQVPVTPKQGLIFFINTDITYWDKVFGGTSVYCRHVRQFGGP